MIGVLALFRGLDRKMLQGPAASSKLRPAKIALKQDRP